MKNKIILFLNILNKYLFSNIEKLIYGRIEKVSLHDNPDVKIQKIYSGGTFKMSSLIDIEYRKKVDEYICSTPEINTYIINNGIFIPGKEEVYDYDGKVFEEITAQKNNPQIGTSKKKIKNYIKLKGKVLCLSLSGLEDNYNHFIVEYLARWYIYKLSNLDYDYIDFNEKLKFQKEFIKLLDIPEKKIISRLQINSPIKADYLIVPSLINNWEYFTMKNKKLHFMKQYLPNWFIDVHKQFRKKFESSEKIFISRSKANRRKITNEKEVIELVNKYGFKVFNMEDLQIVEQINLFNKAKVVIAPHGAGISNIVYCSNPFKLLEIFPENYFDSSYRILAQVLKCEYHYYIAKCPINSNKHPQKEDLYIDCETLNKWLLNL